MKKKLLACLLMGIMMVSAVLTGCESSDSQESESSSSDDKVLRLGIECTFAPYNWTQESEDLPNGEKAVKIENADGYTYGYDVALAQMICDQLGWELEVYKSDWTQESEDLPNGEKAVKIENADGYTYGYDVALAQMICDQLGWELEVYKSDWTAIFMGLEDGTFDCIMSGVCYSEERDETYDFTSAYYERTIKAVVRSDSEFANVTGLSDFDGMNPKVIAQMGTNFTEYKDQIPSYEDAVDYENVSELFLAIQNSTADVLVTDLATSESALNTMTGLTMLDLDPEDNFVAPEGASNDCCILFRGGDEECQIVQEAMDEMGWTSDTEEGLQAMNDLMSEMIELQPSNN